MVEKGVNEKLIDILLDKSRKHDKILKYESMNQIKTLLEQYNINYDESDIDLVYVNIRVEDILNEEIELQEGLK